jgi:hypothetical protein
MTYHLFALMTHFYAGQGAGGGLRLGLSRYAWLSAGRQDLRLEVRAIRAPAPPNDAVVRSVHVSAKNSGGHDNPQPNLAEQDDLASRLPAWCRNESMSCTAMIRFCSIQ